MGDLVEGGFSDSRDARTLVVKDGVTYRGMPPDLTPEQQQRLNAMLAEMQALMEEVNGHPERFIIFREGASADVHRRGDAACSGGRCSGESEALPACPYGCGGLVHHTHYAGQPAQCDGCDKVALMPVDE